MLEPELKNEKVKHTQGKPWTTVAIFNSYKEADMKRSFLIAEEPTFSTKIKRCGDGGSQFKVTKRVDEELAKVAEEMEKITKESKLKKVRSKKKSKK